MAINNQIPFPIKLNLTDSNTATAWKKFHTQWSNYEIATDLSSASSKRRVAVFLACAGSDAQDLFATMDLSDDAKDDIDQVVTAFNNHCIGITNVTY